jgi:tRNA threonylcarbamoyladenosine biosynthesis protein TsaE
MAIAAGLAADSQPGGVFCLCGELGAGKTVFAKGFARGLGITDEITSPTFTLVNAYPTARGFDFFHFDVYRVASPDEMYDAGWEESGEGVCLIEWAELVRDMMPTDAVWITIEKDYAEADDYRRVIIGKPDGNGVISA